MKQRIPFPSLKIGSRLRTRVRAVKTSTSLPWSLSLSSLGGEERDPGNERDQRSRQAEFLDASTPDFSLADSHFAAHV